MVKIKKCFSWGFARNHIRFHAQTKKNRIRHHAECGCKNIIKGAEKQDLGHYSCSYLFAEWVEVLRNRHLLHTQKVTNDKMTNDIKAIRIGGERLI